MHGYAPGLPPRPLTPQLAQLGERDGWTCWLCGDGVLKNATGKNAPTRDHVVPRVRGGSNRMSNLRLAHAGCNSSRGHGNAPAVAHERWGARQVQRVTVAG